MNGEQAQRPTRPAVFSRAGWILLTLAFIAAIILDALFSETGIFQLRELEQEFQRLQLELQKLQRENAELEKQISGFRSGTDALEKVAREELGFVKPGEVTFLFPEKEGSLEAGNPDGNE
jgi:cell division protein FtsB